MQNWQVRQAHRSTYLYITTIPIQYKIWIGFPQAAEIAICWKMNFRLYCGFDQRFVLTCGGLLRIL